ncbi:MAG: ABC transporter permease, partial [Thermoleophilia bacterium]|nr:ABC transporter permease [Thermoleophilia bacterium]
MTAKDLLQARRDKLAFLFTLVLPVIFTVFLGLLIGGQSQSAGLPLAVANEDRGPAAQQLLQQLEAVTALKLEPKALTDCEQAVKKQEVAAALIIPAGFSAKVAANEHSSLTIVRLESLSAAQAVREAVESTLRTFNSTRLVASVATEQTAAALGQVPNDELLRQAQDLAADVL